MTPPDHPPRVRRPVRLALMLWAVVAMIVWNGVYDVGISLGVRDYLMHAALHDAGRGPDLPMAEMMQQTVRQSMRLASFWTSLVLAAGLSTVWLLGRRPHVSRRP
jgi:hypothetical protein